jgi:alpha-amylase/alpha-mannosidase (GH57 family)
MADGDKRYIIIHGHFYQPPRESPWTGLINPEHGAAPFANWNERILSDCYVANAHAHTMDGHLVRIRNNYQSLNFDFGPTLLSWMERHGRIAYRGIQRADTLSVDERGHGNAIAQSYNHSILPLLTARDRDVQIAWGIEDFVFRFGRRPEGMWLPECAADDATLATVAAAGIKYVILAPWQGDFRMPREVDDDGGAGPFAWRAGDQTLAIFRFDRELAASISFGDLMSDGARIAAAIADRALQMRPDSALMVATDGETFGHHKKTGAAELARALEILERRDDLEIVNCSQYLAMHPAAGSFEIHGATSWSCMHGVERWRSNCGCRLDSRTNQEWRGPLREAMDFVKAHIDIIYDRFAAELVADPLAALKQSIRLAIDSDPAAQLEFFNRHKVSIEDHRIRLMRLFEMQRAAHAAFTSCAWFFDDFGGLEGRVALRWAARAIEIAAELAPSAESELLERLRAIHSNRREIGDAATLYLSVKTREARGRV